MILRGEEKMDLDGIVFRNIRQDEAEQAVNIEKICFPPQEADRPEAMRARIAAVPELFLAAVDEKNGRIAGFINGVPTGERSFRDGFFTDISLCDPRGDTVMIVGLDVLPEYRGRGIARALVERYREREKSRGRKRLVLTCHAELVPMYRKMGFADEGIADSSWGGAVWHEMSMEL